MDRDAQTLLVGLLLLGGTAFIGLILLGGLRLTLQPLSVPAPAAWEVQRNLDGQLIQLTARPVSPPLAVAQPLTALPVSLYGGVGTR